MGGVPSIPTDKTRTVQVIGAGYSRTGTVSMSLALEKLLHGPVLHGGTQLLGREDAYAKLWCDIFANRHNKPILMKLLRQATAGFVAVTDNPAICFVTELAELYPDAKVVLVERDPDRWWSSIVTLMRQGSVNGSWRLFTMLLWPCPTWRWAGVWTRGIQQCEEERLGQPFSRDSLAIYNNWVRKNIASDRLLTMELNQGWEPLAKFLGKPVPDEPFPRANDSEAMQQFVQNMFRTAMLVWVGILASAGTAAWMGFAAWKRW